MSRRCRRFVLDLSFAAKHQWYRNHIVRYGNAQEARQVNGKQGKNQKSLLTCVSCDFYDSQCCNSDSPYYDFPVKPKCPYCGEADFDVSPRTNTADCRICGYSWSSIRAWLDAVENTCIPTPKQVEKWQKMFDRPLWSPRRLF